MFVELRCHKSPLIHKLSGVLEISVAPLISPNLSRSFSCSIARRAVWPGSTLQCFTALTKSTMIANNAVRTAATRIGTKRAMSDAAGPKMHKAKDAWKQIHATRPVDPHPHVS